MNIKTLTLLLAPLLLLGCGSADNPVAPDQFPESWYMVPANQRGNLPTLVGKIAPGLTVANWLDGKELKTADMKNKIIVVDLWATWCAPCLAAIPHNNALAKKYADKGVLIVGVCTAQDHDKMTETAKAKGIDYFCAEDTTLATEKAWQVPFYPTYCIVDRKGIVRGAGLSPEGVEKAIEKILEEQPAPATTPAAK